MAFDWFKRKTKNITTSTEDKKDVPKGLWHQTPTGKIIEHEELKANNYVSPEDGFHVRIGSKEFFSILFDDNNYTELHAEVESVDMLNFKDTKSYTDRLKEVKAKTKLTDSIRNGVGKVNGTEMVISCMDFAFIGGSLGSVMGEKIRRAVDYCIEHRLPYMIICQSGGARMQEAVISLMQMAKTSVITGKWHVWLVDKGVLLSNEETKQLRDFKDVDSVVNWLYTYGEKEAARVVNNTLK